ncbi:hypothetical protein N7474_005744 [Penicillium riverlandense]|uniref:uncharacterized protein n=1 Tax=Penicillium riverlandense TaxID=1903569 RepID=UPI002546E0E9|nr:uncharacterized protein N7474_005744 [Penicillium riverlandense]KAJ5820153.1 hypothetical protein N7474_005744 [Penicillium riverlandense]
MRYTLLTLLLFVPFVAADDWEDFTNNLATDLAPLIILFGEKLTKQFLSESITVLDNVIFALSPLGVLTAVVSLIRVCGGASLRAFIGRAQEGPGDAEIELLPCVSESTGELFNDAGISRVFGRPKIVEIVAWEQTDPKTGKKSIEIGTLREALLKKAWYCKGGELQEDEIKGMPELDIPNLSLNKGIKRKSQFWFYCAAGVGTVMQLGQLNVGAELVYSDIDNFDVGVMTYAALTVFAYPSVFKVDGKKVHSYAFPMYIIGTTFLFIGMFFCAFILEHSSKQYYLYPNHPSKIYWLQPGCQDVGDQVFGAFLATYKERDSAFTNNMRYIKSTRISTRGKQHTKIYVTLTLTLIGFVFQFVGQRGLHASVILAQLGSTLFMAVIRACLRTERMTPGENKLNNPKHERQLISEKQKELDCFAFHVDEIKSFNLRSAPLPQNHAPRTTTTSVASKLIRTRIRLAELTSNPHHGINDAWEDLPIRRVTRNLARTIEATMDLLSTWSNNLEKSFDFKITLECERLDEKPLDVVPEIYTFRLSRSPDTGKWRIKQANLEAVLGLWTWSLTKSKAAWRQPTLTRLVGLSEAEAREEETDLYFQKWIFRQRQARFLPSKLINSSRQLFGFHPEKPVTENSQESFSSQSTLCVDMDILAVITDNDVETMAAQDIYIHFLKKAFETFKELGGHVDLIPGARGSYLAYNSRLEDLVRCFESSNLGSREDALLCIIPVLKNRGILPGLSGDSANVRKRTEELVEKGNWQAAVSLVSWLCHRSDGSDFEKSVYKLAFLCHRKMLGGMDENAQKVMTPGQKEGFGQICKLLSSDMRADFFKSRVVVRPANWMESKSRIDWWNAFSEQLGWITWQASVNVESAQWLQPVLKSLRVHPTLRYPKEPEIKAEETPRAVRALSLDLTKSLLEDTEESEPVFVAKTAKEYTAHTSQLQLGLEWAVNNGYFLLVYLMFVRWMDFAAKYKVPATKTTIQNAFVAAAKSRCDWAVKVLLQHDAAMETENDNGVAAFHELVNGGYAKACQVLLENGQDPNRKGPHNLRALSIAATSGHLDVIKVLLDYGADLEYQQSFGSTALAWASQHNQFDAVDMLLSYGANIETCAPDGATPLLSAVEDDHFQMVKFLLEKGANINACDNEGENAVMIAAGRGHANILRFLLAKGAVFHLQNNKGLTALELARNGNHMEVIAILETADGQTA